jgi:endoglucanase
LDERQPGNLEEGGDRWALWDFRESSGSAIVSGRHVEYEDWNGHKLDREMLDLLQAY